jgi:hypothetical protein
MDITQSFPAKYLQKTDFTAPRQVIIDTVAMEDVSMDSQPTELKPVMFFKGAPKGMILNKTNANIMVALFGAETTAWSGQTVEAYNDVTIQFQGQLTGGIRLRPVQVLAQPVAHPVSQPAQPVGAPSVTFATDADLASENPAAGVPDDTVAW